jgi:hypothetical protein
MSSRKWDQAPPTNDDGSAPPSQPPTVDGKTASEAAAAAAAIAAKIAAQFAAGDAGAGREGLDFTHDIDINDMRNRYMLKNSNTQMRVRCVALLLSFSPTLYLTTLFVSRSDTRGNRRSDHHEGSLGTRSFPRNREGPPAVLAYCRRNP